MIDLYNHDKLLHVHDLPQLYTKPSSQELLLTLKLLKSTPPSFEIGSTSSSQVLGPKVIENGVPRYLTSIVSSSLSWLKNEDDRERIWDEASMRLSERAGRNAMPDMTRAFTVNEEITIDLFEPSLTEDNLGLKTWSSSLMLARRLVELKQYIPALSPFDKHTHNVSPSRTRVLELGSGTGLVGIAASCIWRADVLLTDLPTILPNLQRNVATNASLALAHNATIHASVLDWSDPNHAPSSHIPRYPIILAADPVYSSEHPRLLVETVDRWLDHGADARFIVELPLREGFERERDELRRWLKKVGMAVMTEGTESGYDDWIDRDGRPAVVRCLWLVCRRSGDAGECSGIQI